MAEGPGTDHKRVVEESKMSGAPGRPLHSSWLDPRSQVGFGAEVAVRERQVWFGIVKILTRTNLFNERLASRQSSDYLRRH